MRSLTAIQRSVNVNRTYIPHIPTPGRLNHDIPSTKWMDLGLLGAPKHCKTHCFRPECCALDRRCRVRAGKWTVLEDPETWLVKNSRKYPAESHSPDTRAKSRSKSAE